MRHLALTLATPLIGLAALLVGSCNAYDAFRVTGYKQEGFTTRADVLFVIDNSPTMFAASRALALSFDEFIDEFIEEVPDRTPTLSEEVDRYISYLTDRTGGLNYQLGMVTVTTFVDFGELKGRPRVISNRTENSAAAFTRNLLCDTACIDGEIPAGVNCPGGRPSNSDACLDSPQLLEEPLEAVFLALCGAVENPPDECFAPWWWDEATRTWQPQPVGQDTGEEPPEPAPYFDESMIGVNQGFLRRGSVVVPIIVSDGGDRSRRIPGQASRATEYLELFRRFGNRMSFAVIGPDPDQVCNPGGANQWTIDRLVSAVNETNGVYVDLSVPTPSGGCENVNFSDALRRIGQLLRGLADTFPLRNIPEPGTIVVEVDGVPVPEADCRFNAELEQRLCDNGWSYNETTNTVLLHGDAVPSTDADVQVYYLPASGVPRDLPF